MDPASLALGVVPLIFNIVHVCSAVKAKRSSYKSASTEIEDILERVDLICQICIRLEGALASPDPHQDSALVERALRKCYTTVRSIDDDLEKLLKTKEGRQRSIKYAFSKSHIDRSLSNLNDSIFVLTSCLSTSTFLSLHALSVWNSSARVTADEERTSTKVHTAPTAYHGSCGIDQKATKASLPPSIRMGPAQVQRRQTTKTISRSWSWSTSVLLYESAATTVKDENNSIETKYSSFLIGSPMIGTFVSLALRYGPLSPFSLSLDAPSFVYEKRDKSFFDGIMRDAPKPGATQQDVARWVCHYNVKPSMQLVEGIQETRYSLLGMLVACNRPEAFQYLVQRGGQQLMNDQHLHGVLPWQTGDGKLRKNIIKSYVALRGPLLTLEEYAELLLPSRSPDDFMEMFDLCEEALQDDVVEYVSETMDVLILDFGVLHKRFSPEAWASVINKLLSGGLDIHETRIRGIPGRTALRTILRHHFATPTEVMECAQSWVEVLRHTSIDVDGYLYVELMILMEHMEYGFEIPEEWFTEDLEPWHSMDVRPRLEILFDLLNPGLRIPFSVNHGTNDDLLQIMPTLRYGGQHSLSCQYPEQPSHMDWKRIRMDDQSGFLGSWPFLKSTDIVHSWEREYRNLSAWTINIIATHDRFTELICSRSERRQRKKWQKLKRRIPVEEDWSKAPGGWEMEWWEYQGPW